MSAVVRGIEYRGEKKTPVNETLFRRGEPVIGVYTLNPRESRLLRVFTIGTGAIADVLQVDDHNALVLKKRTLLKSGAYKSFGRCPLFGFWGITVSIT